MQSANSEVDQTLGLTQNVPLLLREITFYVQFHVIHNPMYNILLGRPFDVLLVSKPIACLLGGGKAPRLSEVHCDRDSVCVKTDT